MTPVYEVHTKHTRQVLEDFIDFTYKVKYPRVTMNLIIMAGCLGVFAFILRGGTAMYVFGALALAVLGFALLRKRIGVSKLAKADQNYQRQSVIQLKFGESEFRIQNEDEGQDQKVRYTEVSYIYGDNHYYYISIDNEDLQVIPKGDFILGDHTSFYDFISDKTGCPVLPTSVPWKVRIQMMKDYRDVMAEERDKKQAAQKNEKLKKKQNKNQK